MIYSEARPIEGAEQHSQLWHDWRRKTITATNIPALLGLNPPQWNADEASVLASKQPDYEPKPPSAAMKRGTRLEPKVLDWYANERGVIVEHSPPMLQSKSHPWATASIDGFAYAKAEADPWPVEVKTSGIVSPGYLPAYWQAQVQWQLFVTGWQYSDLVAFNTRDKVHWIARIDRADEWIGETVELVDAWRIANGVGDA